MIKAFMDRFKRSGGVSGGHLLFERLEERVLLNAALDVDKDVTGSSETDTTGTDVAIGEEVTYEITSILPEGVTNTVTLTDTLPDNIDFIAGTLSVTPNGPISTDYIDELTSATYVGDVLTVNLGTVVNIFDGDPTNDTITITFTGIVRNDSVNQNGDTRTNEVVLSDGTDSVSDTVDVDIVEPELDVAKDIVGGVTTFEVGDTVTYSILVTHGVGSTASAFEIDLTDTMPVELSSPTLVSATILEVGQADVDVTGSFLLGGGGMLTTTGDVDLLLSGVGGNPQSLSILLSGTVASGVPISTVVSNSVDIVWTSINGASVNERTGIGGGVNDYSGSDPAVFRVGPLPSPDPPLPPADDPPEPPSEPRDPPSFTGFVPATRPFDFVYDAVRDDSVETEMLLDYDLPGLDYVLPGLPVSPLYTGTALPGATLVIRLTDVDGHELAESSLLVGPDGNWLVSFPTAYLKDYPYGIEVRHELMFGTEIGDSKLDDLSLQYTPATNVISLFKYSLNTEWVYHETASRAVEIMHNFVTRPIG